MMIDERDSERARWCESNKAEAQNAADAYLIGECVRGAEITYATEVAHE